MSDSHSFITFNEHKEKAESRAFLIKKKESSIRNTHLIHGSLTLGDVLKEVRDCLMERTMHSQLNQKYQIIQMHWQHFLS